jgi:hypothetical protein
MERESFFAQARQQLASLRERDMLSRDDEPGWWE